MTNASINDKKRSVLRRCRQRIVDSWNKFAKNSKSKRSRTTPAPITAVNYPEKEVVQGAETDIIKDETTSALHTSDIRQHDEFEDSFLAIHAEERGTGLTENMFDKASCDELLPPLPVMPTKKDQRFMSLSEKFRGQSASSDSLKCVIAPVAEGDQVFDLRNQKNEALATLDESVKRNGAFRVIYVRFDDDPDGKRAQPMCIMHDTGSAISLTFERKLRDLGMEFEPLDYNGVLVSVTGECFSPVGRRQICFSYHRKPDKRHWVDVLVLKDPPIDLAPNFDFLFGRDFIMKAKVLIWNNEIIGYVRIDSPRQSPPSLPGENLLVSTNSKTSITSDKVQVNSMPTSWG